MSLVSASELLTWVNTLRFSRDIATTDSAPIIRYNSLKEINSRDIAQIALHTVHAQLSESSDNQVNHALQTRFVFDPDAGAGINGDVSGTKEDPVIEKRNLRAIPSLLVEHNLLVLSSDSSLQSTLPERLSNKEESALIYVLSALYQRRVVVFKPTYNWTAHRRKLIEREILPDGQPTSWNGGGVKSLVSQHQKQESGVQLWNDPQRNIQMSPKEAQMILLQRQQLRCLKTSLACAFLYLPYFAANAVDYEFVYGEKTIVSSQIPDASNCIVSEISTGEKRQRHEDCVNDVENEVEVSRTSKFGSKQNHGGYRQEMQASQSQQDYAWKCIVEAVGGF